MTSRQDDKAPLQFPHHQLDAYRVALEALKLADEMAKRVPRGYGPLCDQLRRASQSAFLQLAEGSARCNCASLRRTSLYSVQQAGLRTGRFGADRAQRLRGARAEACEAAACVEAMGYLGLAPAAETAALLALLGRLAAMLTRLIR